MENMSLIDRVRLTVETHRMLPEFARPAQMPVVLMVSGGSDSVALARLLPEMYPRCFYTILHINHQLRGEDADGDERFVSALAEELGLPCEVRRIDVAALAAVRANGNVEDVGRDVRYRAANEVLDELCRQTGLAPAQGRIATAHTRDDRVETLFMRLVVGGGGSGLSSIPFVNERAIRPLLDCTRAELREELRKRSSVSAVLRRGVACNALACDPTCPVSPHELWREDASNKDTQRLRAFVRHEVIPLLETRNPDLLTTVARSLDVLADEDSYLQARVDELLEQNCAWHSTKAPDPSDPSDPSDPPDPSAPSDPSDSPAPPKSSDFPAVLDQPNQPNPSAQSELHLSTALFDENPVIVRRVVRAACKCVMPANARLTFAHIDNIAKNGRHIGFATDIPGDVTVRNVYGTLVIRQKTAAEKPRHDPRHADGREGSVV
jgi:tRNA(Ile)-lysidine synthase